MNLWTRRGVVAAGSAVALLAVTGGAAQALDSNKAFLRPPGAVEPREFLARCIRCQRCLSVCEARVIQPLSVAESLAGVSTPTLNFSRAYCDFCASTEADVPRCAAVCPTGALSLAEEVRAINGVAVIDQKTCVAWDWKGCSVCIEACPEQAIFENEEGLPVVDESMCNGCGACELLCPAPSLRSSSATGAVGAAITVQPFEGGAL